MDCAAPVGEPVVDGGERGDVFEAGLTDGECLGRPRR